MADLDSDPDLARLCERLARYAALAVAALGAAVLVGWGLDIALLKSVRPEWVSMKANTALGFMLAGAALLMATPGAAAGWRAPRRGLAALLAILGLLNIGEYAWDADFGIDQLLVAASAESMVDAPPGRMALATAVAFATTGLALLCLDGRRRFVVAQVAALLGTAIGALVVLGYAFGVRALYSVGMYSSVAIHTAAGLCAANLGVLLSRPRLGVLAIMTSDTAGGVMARRLLPLALFAPFGIGWLLIQGGDLSPLGFRFSVALASLAYIVLFTTVVLRTARLLGDSHMAQLAAREALRKQHEQWSGIIESAMDGIIMVDGALRICLFNPAAEQMFGRKAVEVLGGPLDLLIPPRFREAHVRQIRAFVRSGERRRRVGRHGSFTGLRASGGEFPIEASISYLEVDGRRQFTIILRDISDRYRAEQAMIESRRQLTAMIEQAPISIAMFDRDMNYLATSRRWFADHAIAETNLKGRKHYEVFPDISPYWKKVHQDGMAGITTSNDSDLWIKADGSRQWLRWAVHPWVEEGGRVGGIIISTEDITHYKNVELALRASEEDLKRAQAVARIGSWRLDVRRNELTWSSENYRIFGLLEGMPLSYETFLSRVHPADRNYVDRKWQAALVKEPFSYDIEHRALVDGQVLWLREKAELEFDADGQLLGAFGITQDITGRRQAEEQLQQANDRLAAVAAERAADLRELSSALFLAEQRERDHFYELLHDHVQPLLVAIRLGLSGLGEHSSKRDVLQTVDEAKEQISQVIQAARTLSVELSPPLIRERGLVPALESLGRWMASKYGLVVHLACEPGTEPASMTIRLLCFNAVRELLMNVVKYAAVQQVAVELRREGRDTLQIVVSDRGAGFDPAETHDGSGVPNLERRLGMVGGSLSIESAVGKGTTATLRAPLERRMQKRPRGAGMRARLPADRDGENSDADDDVCI